MTSEVREDTSNGPVDSRGVDTSGERLTKPRRGSALRALVRQLAAAVYVVLLHSFVAQWLVTLPLLGLAVEMALVFAASALLAKVTDGPLRTVALVGPFVALFSLVIALTAVEWSSLDAQFWILRAAHFVWLSGAGLLGVYVVRPAGTGLAFAQRWNRPSCARRRRTSRPPRPR